MQTLKVRKIGNSLGIIIPREMQETLRVEEGDVLYSSPTEQGVELTPYDPDFEVAMKAFERTRRKYRNALKELAK
jgi:putative addiction module antidote